jgi:L-cysteine S-thiosulfotransferase
MTKKITFVAIGSLAAMLIAACASVPEPTSAQVAAVFKRDFHPRGQAKIDWVIQDDVQRICTETDDKPSAEVAKRLEAEQMKTVKFPADGKLMGDWKNGHKIAASGRGMTWRDKPDAENGGSCYNCHQLSPEEQSFGTLGPSLKGFGKVRGSSPEIQKYVYGKIYNAKAYSACSQMPRLGWSGTLTEKQIKDMVAYLLDPASPVNK